MDDTLNQVVIGDFVSSFLLQLLIAVIVVIIIAIFNQRIYRYVRYAFAYITNKPIRITVELHQRYEGSPVSEFTSEIFETVKKEGSNDSLRKVVIAPHRIEIRSEHLGMNILAILDEEFETSEVGFAEQVSVVGYYVRIKHGADIKGFRRLDEVQDFVNLASKIGQSISFISFNKETPTQTYALCHIKGLLTTSYSETYVESSLNGEVSTHEKVITIKTEEPYNLSRIITKSLRRHI